MPLLQNDLVNIDDYWLIALQKAEEKLNNMHKEIQDRNKKAEEHHQIKYGPWNVVNRNQKQMQIARDLLVNQIFCSYCGNFGTETKDKENNTWEIDHIIPVSRGGTNDLHNLTKACQNCNKSKSNQIGWVLIANALNASQLQQTEAA